MDPSKPVPPRPPFPTVETLTRDSLSRSNTSPDEVRALADKALRLSLDRRADTPTTNPALASGARRNGPRSRPPTGHASSSPSSSASLLRSDASRDSIKQRAEAALRASLTRDSSPATSRASTANTICATDASPQTSRSRDRTEPVKPGSRSATRRSLNNAPAATPTAMTEAQQRERMRWLLNEENKVQQRVPQRSSKGIFKKRASTDLLFLIDATNSMQPYIDAARNQVRSIIADIKAVFLQEAVVRIAVVSYTDHGATPNVTFLDFTEDVDQVYQFLDSIDTQYGYDFPENVLGGIHQACNASWNQSLRCVVHIGDAPPHGEGLHDFSENDDRYYTPGSEPHGLTYEPLINQLFKLNVNYAFCAITKYTDKMSWAFSSIYGVKGLAKLHPDNAYYDEDQVSRAEAHIAGPKYEELKLGASYQDLRHLIVQSVTSSLSPSGSSVDITNKPINYRVGRQLATLPTIDETLSNNASLRSSRLPSNEPTVRESSAGGASDHDMDDIELDKSEPRWDTPNWLDLRLELEGYCPEVAVHTATTLNDMLESDENVKLGVAQLTLRARSKPFDRGGVRLAHYAGLDATAEKFVVKSFIKDGGLAEMAEDMRIQAICKAFALEFNSMVRLPQPLDFIVTMCLQQKEHGQEPLSLEPYIPGQYEKYNNNAGFVMQDSGSFYNQAAQAFSHFTFERSWGKLLVVDLQGAGTVLTDPTIHTWDTERFKLTSTNFGEDGFKFFFATHECNHFCRNLELKSNGSMLISGDFQFRSKWPAMERTVCCSSKLCRKIIRLANANKSDKYKDCHWCSSCWPQLEATMTTWMCEHEVGPIHDFQYSKFFYESQARLMPRKCSRHVERERAAGAPALGANLWDKISAKTEVNEVDGSQW